MKGFWRLPWPWLVLLLALGLRLPGLACDLPWHAEWDEYRAHRTLYYVATHRGRPLDQLNPPLYVYAWGAAVVPVGLAASGGSTRGLLDAYVVRPDLYYLTGRGLSLVFGLWAILLLGRLAWRRYGELASVAAMLILALDTHHVLASQMATSTSMGLWTFVLALGAAFDCAESVRPWRSALWAGALCGLAGATKYNCGLVALVLAGVLLQEKDGLRRLLLAGAAAVGAFVLFNPWAALDPRDFIYWLVRQSRQTGHDVFGWGDMADFGTRALAWTTAFPLVLRIAAPFLLLWALLRLRQERILAGFITAYTVFLMIRAYPQLRYLLLVAVGLALLAGAALSRLPARRGRLALAVLLLALLPSVAFTLRRGWLRAQTSTFQQAAGWIIRNLPEGEGVMSDDPVFIRRLPSADYDTFEGGKRPDLLAAWKARQGGKLFRIPVDLFSVGGPFATDQGAKRDPEVYRKRGIRTFVMSGVGSSRLDWPEQFRKEAVLAARFTPMKDPARPVPTRDWDMAGFFNRLENLNAMERWGTEVRIYRWPPGEAR